jgi:hypothetical protein
MSRRDAAPAHSAAVLGTGLAAVLGGTALLLEALGVLPLGWDVLLPLLLLVVGAATAAAGLVGASRGSR